MLRRGRPIYSWDLAGLGRRTGVCPIPALVEGVLAVVTGPCLGGSSWTLQCEIEKKPLELNQPHAPKGREKRTHYMFGHLPMGERP
jgi:hypothetical protein